MAESILEPQQQRRFRQTARAMCNAAIDADGFAVAVQLREELDEMLRSRAAELTNPKLPKAARFTWSEIGRALGVTRQSAHERWGRRH